jgi:hypothetical protein
MAWSEDVDLTFPYGTDPEIVERARAAGWKADTNPGDVG